MIHGGSSRGAQSMPRTLPHLVGTVHGPQTSQPPQGAGGFPGGASVMSGMQPLTKEELEMYLLL